VIDGHEGQRLLRIIRQDRVGGGGRRWCCVHAGHAHGEDRRGNVPRRIQAKLADFLAAEVVDDISREDLRVLLREEGVSFRRKKTWKTSRNLSRT